MKFKKDFLERMEKLLGNEIDEWKACLDKPIPKTVRVNTIKISKENLKKRLERKWKVEAIKGFDQAFIIKEHLPGELGNSIEHKLGYFYVQTLSSMMPPLALEPKEKELILDLCAAPGAKTTQIAAMMNNKGTIIANEPKFKRIRALVSNLERCGVTNTVVTKMDGIKLVKKIKKKIRFDKILVDVPCSATGSREGSAFKMWNLNMIKGLAGLQKKLAATALSCLKENGILVYSTCSLEPEENEAVIDFLVKNFDVQIEEFKLPIKSRKAITEWQSLKFDKAVRKCKRIYQHDNDSEGFFIARLRKIK